ncbi:unnamed protein product [Rotaria socialis]|uniref:Uncharacterized protein n=1 Tax=Rotaria socialis TaxID=392032 RepID=A0A817ZW58_9BILA|nr:unnamed protein product [Rotaria socialis]
MKLARRLNLDKSGIKILLNDIRRLFPSDLKLPRSVQGLMKIIGFDYSKKVIYYCCECLSRLTNPEQKTCVDGYSLNNVRRPFRNVIEVAINNIKDEVYATAKRHINLINEYSQCSNVFLPYDVLNGSIYERLKKNQKQLTLALHTDGAPVTKMGGKSLWPVQATILEFPPPIRDHIKFNIRVQFITFDLPALAHNCNIVQFNGYDACPFCKAHGYAIGTQIFYAHSPTPSIKKTDGDYLRLSTTDLPRLGSHGIKGPTPLTNIMLFPYQIAVDYMHLVCSGHFKTLIIYWNQLLLPDVFEQASNFLLSITLPHSFGYQFVSIIQFANWKTKMFRDFLLYISPIFAIQFLPDELTLHFLYYFIYIRVLRFYQDKNELQGVDHFFNYYYENLSKHYGPKSELCTIHIHSHLLGQVRRHGSLSMTSCFPRESYIGNAIKWCQGKKYMLEQFITWYKIDHSLYPDSTLNMTYLTQNQRFDDKYLNKRLIASLDEKFIKCCNKKNIQLDTRKRIKQYGRYFRGLKTFHSLSYERGGNAISYWVFVKDNECSQNHGICFGEVVYYCQLDNEYYAFLKHLNALIKVWQMV